MLKFSKSGSKISPTPKLSRLTLIAKITILIVDNLNFDVLFLYSFIIHNAIYKNITDDKSEIFIFKVDMNFEPINEPRPVRPKCINPTIIDSKRAYFILKNEPSDNANPKVSRLRLIAKIIVYIIVYHQLIILNLFNFIILISIFLHVRIRLISFT